LRLPKVISEKVGANLRVCHDSLGESPSFRKLLLANDYMDAFSISICPLL
jgi:hypothetical protein